MKNTYVAPTLGMIFLAAENTMVNPGPTRDAELFARWTLAVNQQNALDRSALLAEDYQNAFQNDWLVNYQSGRMFGPRGQGDPDAVPPVPPYQYVVIVTGNGQTPTMDVIPGDSAVDSIREMMRSGVIVKNPNPPGLKIPRVCDVPKYERIPPPTKWVKQEVPADPGDMLG